MPEFSGVFALFYRAEFKDIFRIFASWGSFFFSLPEGCGSTPMPCVTRVVPLLRPFTTTFQGVAQGAVTGTVCGNEVRDVDRARSPGATLSGPACGAVRWLSAGGGRDGSCGASHSHSRRCSGRAVRAGYRQRPGVLWSAAGRLRHRPDRASMLFFRTRGDVALYGESGDLLPLAGVDRQLFRKRSPDGSWGS